MRQFLSRASVMAFKETLHIRRDPQVLAFALLLPVAMLLLFGYALSFDLDNIPLVVVDQDHTPQSRELVHKFSAGELFVVRAELDSAEDVDTWFRRGKAKAALVVPHGYARAMARRELATVQLLVDGSDNNSASVAIGYANAMASAAALQGPSISRAPLSLNISTRALFNPELKSAIFIVPGLIALIPALVAVMMTALTIAREFERGSMEQLFSTPVGRLEIVLGKIAPYLGLGLLQVALVVATGVVLFEVPFEGSVVVLFAVSTLFLMAVLAQGLVVSVITRNQVIASQVALITTLLPTMLLSGFIFPVTNMPIPLQVIANILPAQHFMTAVRAIVLRGNGWSEVAMPMAAVFAYFLFMTTVAVARFRRTAS